VIVNLKELSDQTLDKLHLALSLNVAAAALKGEEKPSDFAGACTRLAETYAERRRRHPRKSLLCSALGKRPT
jgi:hypothetical protein